MKSYTNIEKSAFRKGEYVGYCAGRVYHIRKSHGGYWFARNRDDGKDHFLAFGLESMSQKLQAKAVTA